MRRFHAHQFVYDKWRAGLKLPSSLDFGLFLFGKVKVRLKLFLGRSVKQMQKKESDWLLLSCFRLKSGIFLLFGSVFVFFVFFCKIFNYNFYNTFKYFNFNYIFLNFEILHITVGGVFVPDSVF